MSYEPLHHKYRPQTFKDLVGQEAIAQTLINAITTNRIAPAYLFTGPRGTGKTSSARILAKSLNCLDSNQPTPTPCGQCEVCRAIARSSALDVIEIDAASNTGVDNIREIIERSQFAPVQCRYKVYVIDECHMLSVAAFNALLKTLEEPPNRVVFVLATTDPQRVLPTIISRCQRFDYRRIPLEDMVKHLLHIASKENINIDDQAITLVAQIANGGLRDAESLLDQLSLLSGTVTPDRVWDLVGAIPELDLLSLIKAIRSKNPETILECCRHLMNRGKEPLTVLQNLAGFYLNLVIAKTAPTRSDLVAVTASTWTELCQEAQQWKLEDILQGQQHLKESEVQLKNTTQPRLWLEVTLLGLLSLGVSWQPVTEQQPITINSKVNPAPVQNLPKTPTPPPPQPEPQPEPEPEPVKNSPPPPPIIEEPVAVGTEPVPYPNENNELSEDLEQLWKKVLANVKLPTTQALFSQQGHLISFEGSVAVVSVNSEKLFKLHQSKIPELEAAFKAIFQESIKVNIQVGNVNQSLTTNPQKTTMTKVYSNAADLDREINPLNEKYSQDVQISVNGNGNGKSSEVQPLVTPEIVSQSPLIEPDVTTEEPPEIENSPSVSDEKETKNYSDKEIQKAVEVLIKAFEGELIETEQKVESEEQLPIKEPEISNHVTPVNETSNLIDLTRKRQEKQAKIELKKDEQNTKPRIAGRLDISNMSEDDLDF